MEKKVIKLKDSPKEMSLEEVYEQFKKFLYKSCQSWQGIYDLDDLLQVAYLGLHKSYKSYDVSKGVLFLTYASRIIANELLMHHRKNKKHIQNMSFNSAISEDINGIVLTLEDIVQDEINYENQALINVQCEELKVALDSLEPRDREIIESIAFNDKDQKEVANKLHLSQSYISRKHKTILGKLKKMLEGTNLMNAKMTKQQLIKEVKKHGTGKQAYEIIGKKYGLTPSTVKFNISTMKIRQEIAKLESACNDAAASEEVKKYEEVKVTDTAETPINREDAEPIIEQVFKGDVGEYEISSTSIRVEFLGTAILIEHAELEIFIKDLQEVNKLLKVV